MEELASVQSMILSPEVQAKLAVNPEFLRLLESIREPAEIVPAQNRQQEDHDDSGDESQPSQDQDDDLPADTSMVPSVPLKEVLHSYQTSPASAMDDWNWRKHKGAAKNKEGKVTHQLFKCNQANGLTKNATGCPATLKVDYRTNPHTYTPTGLHNHPPPKAVKQNQNVAISELTKRVLESPVSLSNGHKQITAEVKKMNKSRASKLPDDSPLKRKLEECPTTGAPTKEQLADQRCNKRRKQKTFTNPWEEFATDKYKDFIRATITVPRKAIVLVHRDAIPLLKKALYVHLDDTFNVFKDRFLLTTLMIEVDKVPVPAAWFVHIGESAEDYEWFLREVESVTKMRPQYFFGDFAHAIRNACQTVFPGSSFCGDFWHFLNSNTRWFRGSFKDVSAEVVGQLVQDLRFLYASSSKTVFDENLKKFKSNWVNFNGYVTYFEAQWERATPSGLWAYYARPPGALSGDNILEAWHNRIKRDQYAGRYSLVAGVDALRQEVEYALSILNDPVQKEAYLKRRDHHQRLSARRKKSSTSNHGISIEEVFDEEEEIEQGQIAPANEPPSLEMNITADESALATQQLDSSEPDSQEDTLVVHSLSSPPPSGSNRRHYSPSQERCRLCGQNPNSQRLANTKCILKACNRCCAKAKAICSVPAHTYEKIRKHEPYISFTNILQQKLSSKDKRLWISYKKEDDQLPKRRAVELVTYGGGAFFLAKCLCGESGCDSNIEKKFLIMRCHEMEAQTM
eukprot:TRINITY_DN9536_c2_g3_i1.p1 TRINITY_DN9536_c2_g3~~TRINITY_DN9536_c2_g3_i1.p1  ORF type:complete len:741 (-),score=115.01 TRINITY_DN9536_c2_g3_i1:67-2289(-)